MKTVRLHRQLPLRLFSEKPATFENFFCNTGNRELLAALKNMSPAEPRQIIFICGPSGEGRSHLLQAVFRNWWNSDDNACYLPLADLIRNAVPEILNGLDSCGVLCIDDVQAVAGNGHWQEALLNLFNKAVAADRSLLFAADAAVADLGLTLADLSSRLSSATRYRINPLTDTERIELVRQVSAQRGIILSPEVLSYIYRRVVRSTGVLLQLAEHLEYFALAGRRPITVPLAKELLSWQRDSTAPTALSQPHEHV